MSLACHLHVRFFFLFPLDHPAVGLMLTHETGLMLTYDSTNPKLTNDSTTPKFGNPILQTMVASYRQCGGDWQVHLMNAISEQLLNAISEQLRRCSEEQPC
jgi:hypothetical protein